MTSPVTEPAFADGYMVCFDGSTDTSRRVAIPDAATLAAAVTFVETLPDDLRRASSRRVLTKRARELGCQHVIPTSWLRQARHRHRCDATPTAPDATADTPGRH